MNAEKKNKSWKEKLQNPYRVVVLDDSTFEEKTSFTLSALNLFVFIGSLSLFLIFILTYVIAFTSLREYIPGYADVKLRRNVTELMQRADSLEESLLAKDLYIKNLDDVLHDRVSVKQIETAVKSKGVNFEELNVSKSPSEESFRKEIENKDKNSLAYSSGKSGMDGIAGLFFFNPAVGMVSSSFNSSENHFGIDIVTKKDESIKSTLAGTIIYSGWTSESGYMIQIQHNNDIVSVYKHNSVVLKNEGERVNAGQVIAIVGNSGELTTGPHLHFEIWHKGTAIDPQDYISF
ncbi:MAG: M23 family metallopeptidase [Bacteroidota bacterium]|jgi:murein DD-endopeptidase MepM/ murein hydrolase activator NlpD